MSDRMKRQYALTLVEVACLVGRHLIAREQLTGRWQAHMHVIQAPPGGIDTVITTLTLVPEVEEPKEGA